MLSAPPSVLVPVSVNPGTLRDLGPCELGRRRAAYCAQLDAGPDASATEIGWAAADLLETAGMPGLLEDCWLDNDLTLDSDEDRQAFAAYRAAFFAGLCNLL